MGWLEFLEWLGAMRREHEALEVGPDSWRGAESDPWWVNARREREEQQGR